MCSLACTTHKKTAHVQYTCTYHTCDFSFDVQNVANASCVSIPMETALPSPWKEEEGWCGEDAYDM